MPVLNLIPVANGDQVDQDLFNSRFSAIADLLNGGLDSDNLAAGGVSTPSLAASAVTTAKINDAAVTPTKWTNPYKFGVYLNGSLAIGAGATSVVTFDTKEFDTSSNVDITTNKGRFTAPAAGFYQFNWAVTCTEAGGSFYNSQLRKNGTLVKTGTGFIQGAGTGSGSHVGSAIISLAANDYVEVYFLNSSGGSKALINDSGGTWFQGFLVSLT